MEKTLEELRRTYRLPAETTPEELETRWSKTVTFDNYTLITGYYYSPDKKSYFSAIYRFVTADHTCEGRIRLTAVSDRRFEDDGHALAWGMNKTYEL